MSSVRLIPFLCLSSSILLGCGGSVESSSSGGGGGVGGGNGVVPTNQSVFQDASADCSDCVYIMRGLIWPSHIAVGGGWLYVADGTAAQVRRVPLTGGSDELVSEHVKVINFAANDSALYFTSVDPIDSSISVIWRIDHASGQRAPVARYLSADGEPIYLLGIDGDGPIMMGTTADDVAVLYRLAEDGSRTVVRQWPSADTSPALDCISLLPNGELVWCDPVEGVWSAPSLSEAGVHTSTGWRATRSESDMLALVVGNDYSSDPERVQRLYQRALDDTNEHLTEVARASGDLIRPPWHSMADGVVGVGSQSSQLRFWNLDAPPVDLLPSNLVLVNSVVTVSDNAAYFAAYPTGGKPSTYRMPLVR